MRRVPSTVLVLVLACAVLAGCGPAPARPATAPEVLALAGSLGGGDAAGPPAAEALASSVDLKAVVGDTLWAADESATRNGWAGARDLAATASDWEAWSRGKSGEDVARAFLADLVADYSEGDGSYRDAIAAGFTMLMPLASLDDAPYGGSSEPTMALGPDGDRVTAIAEDGLAVTYLLARNADGSLRVTGLDRESLVGGMETLVADPSTEDPERVQCEASMQAVTLGMLALGEEYPQDPLDTAAGWWPAMARLVPDYVQYAPECPSDGSYGFTADGRVRCSVHGTAERPR